MDPSEHAHQSVAGLPRDPEHEPSASYALDPAYVRRLTAAVRSSGEQTQRTVAPFTLQPVADVPVSGDDDIAGAFEAARTVQEAWARTSYAHRARLLLDLHDLVLDRQDELIDLIQIESGKARAHALDEVLHVALAARYYGRTLEHHLRTRRGVGAYPALTRVLVHRVPKGVIGVISPWNYPLTLAISDGLAALAAGNAVVHKPDSQTPLVALAGVELLTAAGFPTGLWQVVTGSGRAVGTGIIEHADHVCFTGSTTTGRTVARRAADRLVGCSLELGGKNPMLVLGDADPARAAEGAVRACFSSAGQLCVSAERLYVADAVYDRFMAAFLARVESMRLSAALAYGGDMGSLVSADQLAAVSDHVDDAVAHGATVLAGGRPRPDVGPYFYEPTVLTGVGPQMRCFAQETFGPVVAVYRCGSEADAVARANDGEYGLNASVFTRDLAHGRRVARRIRAGTVNINEGFAASFASIDAPMGGMAQSGLGRRHGAEGIVRFTETQTVASQSLLPLAAPRPVSQARYAKVVTGALRLLKATRRP